MGRVRYRRCRICNRGPDEVGPISARGLCAEDGDRLMLENLAQLRDKRGPWFERWYHEMHLAFEHDRLPAAE